MSSPTSGAGQEPVEEERREGGSLSADTTVSLGALSTPEVAEPSEARLSDADEAAVQALPGARRC
jgi:hypothetical protein